MTETITEVPAATTFNPGDRVRVAAEAYDGEGFRTRVAGKLGKLDFRDFNTGWFVRPDDGTPGGYVSDQYLTKLPDPEKLQAEITRLTAEVTRLTAERDTLDAFKVSARNVLVRKAEDAYDDDDAEPFDDLLSELNLEGRERDFNLRVNFDGSFYTTVTATNLDDAIRQAGEYSFVREYVESNINGDWLDGVEAERDDD